MAKSPYDIAPDATYAQAARTSLKQQLDALMTNLPGTREGTDIEALHDMRVASRRLRAALSVFAAAFPPKPFKVLEKEAARVTDALGAVRDADVLIEFMEQACEAAPESERVGLQAFTEQVRKERDKDRVRLVKELDRLEKSDFEKDFAKLFREDDANQEVKSYG